jgi:cell division protein FtsN
MSPSPTNNTLMRVLVGPYNDTESMGRVKSQLENAGLHPIRNNLK